jgi:L-aspartate oxidase
VSAATRLLSQDPGWTVETDVVVVGSGVAGLTTALHAARAGRVLVVTKVHVDDGSTRWAQGGVAAALGADDSPYEHEQDTLEAGVGICDVAAVRVLCEEGPARLRELMALGAAFDLDPSGELSLTREGGHHRDRIVHAGGDATGAEVSRALVAAVLAHPRIQVIEHALVLDLLRTAEGRAAGITLHVLGEGTQDGVGAVLARAVILATGGMGQVFSSTTNPSVSTGDGVALALRAGAEVTDLEFVQFHPTALWLGPGATGQQPLISEAVRGEGAFLVDGTGARVITLADHPLADLAPRDVVAKAITRRMHALSTDHVFLDARGIVGMEARFPTIVARCREAGIDPLVDLIPVAPAAHYASGGVLTDLNGHTSVPGLYACGNLDRGSWIVGVAHRLQPLPAVLSPATREQVREVMERSLTLGSEIFGSNQQRYRPVRDLGDAALNPRVGLRRWVMQTTRDGSPDSLAEDVLVELRHDGSVAFACSTEGWYAPVLEDKHQVPAALVAGHAADFTALVAAVMEQYGDSSGMTYRIGLVRPAPDKPFAAIDVQRAGGITFNVLEQPSWSRTVRRFTPVVGEFPGVAEADAWREIARQMALDTLNQFGISNVPDI